MRNALLLLVGLAVLGGAWWFVSQAPAPVIKTQAQSNLSYALTAEGDRYHEEITDLYSVKATYPNVSDAKVQAAVDAAIEDEIANFKSDAVSLIDETEAARIREQGRPYELGIEYKAYPSTKFDSYEFDIYLNTGGAHPNAFYRTLVLDKEGSEVTLQDLFTGGARYLDRLSIEAYPLVISQLEARVGSQVTPEMADTVRLGTEPSPEALQFFYLTDDALHLLFPPYQVAAYAAGSFDVAIPLSDLSDILKPGIAAQ